MNKIICETCQEQGLKSTVQSSYSMSTCLGYHDFYDEDGNQHCHDPNTTTTDFTCSNGHKFTKKSKRSCWCGWNK